jgi:7-carboxy-7-deazaguanine synthase
MQVFDIFRSIQGEASRVGLPMWFVRLAGCDLACSYCDTPAARDPSAGRDMAVQTIIETIEAGGALPWVLLTGGEPLLQHAQTNLLARALIDRGYEVLVETSGAHPIDLLDARARRIVDVKTPGSGMADRNDWRNMALLAPEDEVKFVLTDRKDYEWAKDVVERYSLLDRAAVLFGAATPNQELRAVAEWILQDLLPVRLNLQAHKWLHLP